ncbi:hypothetical protein [Streptomyces sp. NPDC057694]
MTLLWHFMSDDSWLASVVAAAVWAVLWSAIFFWWVRRADQR